MAIKGTSTKNAHVVWATLKSSHPMIVRSKKARRLELLDPFHRTF